MAESITIQATINKPVETVWKLYTEPAHITKWNNASVDWHTPRAENNPVKGGTFTYRMESKDGKMGFDFNGTYTDIKLHHLLAYTIEDGRTVTVAFVTHGNKTKVTVTFEAETENSLEMQQQGWQAILNNFKRYAETINI